METPEPSQCTRFPFTRPQKSALQQHFNMVTSHLHSDRLSLLPSSAMQEHPTLYRGLILSPGSLHRFTLCAGPRASTLAVPLSFSQESCWHSSRFYHRECSKREKSSRGIIRILRGYNLKKYITILILYLEDGK